LISRRKALMAALDIIDREGLDAMRIRRLGDELGVNGASLYHHFRNKDEIVAGAAELALQYVRTPDTRNEDWPVWLLRNTRRTRDALMQHPHLIPVVLGRAPLGIGTAMLESSAALLEEQGVPVDFILPLMETLEMLAIASAMYSRREDDLGGAKLTYHDHPTLLRASRYRDGAAETLFEGACQSVISTIQDRIAKSQQRPGARKAAVRAVKTTKATKPASRATKAPARRPRHAAESA
jgi:TetR/AcrR family transcriptional regulator, tetracycline repressor protein